MPNTILAIFGNFGEQLANVLRQYAPLCTSYAGPLIVLIILLASVAYFSNTNTTRASLDTHDNITPSQLNHQPYTMPAMNERQMRRTCDQFWRTMSTRRTVRHFSGESVSMAVIERAIATAATAPSGANTQPWTFVVVTNAATKQHIRQIVEREEEVNYKRRMGARWVNDLRPLGTDWHKPYLTDAPVLILVFRHTYGVIKHNEHGPPQQAEAGRHDNAYDDQSAAGRHGNGDKTEDDRHGVNVAGIDDREQSGGEEEVSDGDNTGPHAQHNNEPSVKRQHRFTTYYNEISTSIACGLLLAALHTAGLATLTSTPLNCGAQLRRLLRRPANEKLLLLMPVGRPHRQCRVPRITRKSLEQVLVKI